VHREATIAPAQTYVFCISSNKAWQEVLKLRNAYTAHGRCGMFGAVRTGVYFLLLPYIFFWWREQGQYYPSTFHLEGLKQPVPLAAPSKATSRLLGLRVRIRSGAWIDVFCEYYVLSGRDLCDEVIIHPEEFYRLWSVVVCVLIFLL